MIDLQKRQILLDDQVRRLLPAASRASVRCPLCDWTVRVHRNGKLWTHWVTEGMADGRGRGPICRGSGQTTEGR